MIEYEWVVFEFAVHPKRFKCLRCGAEEFVDMPISIQDFVKRGDVFTIQHRGCQE